MDGVHTATAIESLILHRLTDEVPIVQRYLEVRLRKQINALGNGSAVIIPGILHEGLALIHDELSKLVLCSRVEDVIMPRSENCVVEQHVRAVGVLPVVGQQQEVQRQDEWAIAPEGPSSEKPRAKYRGTKHTSGFKRYCYFLANILIW